MDILLNFINHSNDANNSSIVIFQKNVATNFEEWAVAWKVIRHCGLGDNHPFVYPVEMCVCASDSYGNHTPKLAAQNGELVAMALTNSGDTLAQAGSSTSKSDVQILNDLPRGSIDAKIYKDGRLLAAKTSLAPQQKAVFQFKPTIWIGVVSQVVEGQVMNSAILSAVNTELSLLGVAKADILLTGGGPGQQSKPFEFSLDNVVMA